MASNSMYDDPEWKKFEYQFFKELCEELEQDYQESQALNEHIEDQGKESGKSTIREIHMKDKRG